MSQHTQAPWMAVAMDGGRVVIDTAGAPVCALPDNLRRDAEEMAANAELIALAPELFSCVGDLVDALLALRGAAIVSGMPIDLEGSDAALDDAQALLDLLAEAGITADDAGESSDGIVTIPLPMMTPPVVIAAFKTANGDIGFIVHADDERKTFIAQYGVSPALFAWARTTLQADGPLCGVLRDNRRVVGAIGFYPDRTLRLTLGGETHAVALAQEDLDDIVNLFGEA